MTQKRHMGTTFDSFLDEEGIRDEVELLALKKVLAGRIAACMEKDNLNRTVLAQRMHTSRTLVNRLLDPCDASVTLSTLAKVSQALKVPLAVLLTGRKGRSGRRSAA